MWTRPHITDEVMPLEVSGPDGKITAFLVAIVPAGDAEPTDGYLSAETDGAAVGPRVSGLSRGKYQAFVKVGTRVLNPVSFYLT